MARRQVDRLLAFLSDPDPATYPKRDRAPAEVQGLAQELLDGDGFLEEGPFEVPFESPFIAYYRELEDVEELVVTVKLGEARPLYRSGGSGPFLPDPREVSRLISVRAL